MERRRAPRPAPPAPRLAGPPPVPHEAHEAAALCAQVGIPRHAVCAVVPRDVWDGRAPHPRATRAAGWRAGRGGRGAGASAGGAPQARGWARSRLRVSWRRADRRVAPPRRAGDASQATCVREREHLRDETCPVSTGGRDETCPLSTRGRGGATSCPRLPPPHAPRASAPRPAPRECAGGAPHPRRRRRRRGARGAGGRSGGGGGRLSGRSSPRRSSRLCTG
jgi:hypothetical protein